MSYSREFIGNVQVKSGKLILTDPANLTKNAARIGAEAGPAAAKVDEGDSGEIGPGLAVAFGTPFQDGEYPVFVAKNEKGDITGVEIGMSVE